MQSATIAAKFHTIWTQEAERARLAGLGNSAGLPGATTLGQAPARALRRLWRRLCRKTLPQPTPAAAKGAQPNLAYVLYRMAPGHILRALAARLVAELAPVAIPVLIKLATSYAQQKRHEARRAHRQAGGPPDWQGYLLVAAMFVMLLLYSWSFQWYFYEIGKAAIVARSALVSAIYRKSLVLSAQARARLTLGKMTNLVSSDIGQVERGVMNVIICITVPIQVVASIAVLVYMIGPPGIAGWAIVVAFVPAQMWIARYLVALRGRAMAYTDRRIRATREALQGVNVVKAFVWEESILENVRRVRVKELGAIARLNLIRYCLISLSLHAPVFAAVIAFAIIALSGGALRDGPVFAAIGIFNAMSLPMSWLPGALTEAKNTRVPLGRITEALLEEELEPVLDACPDLGAAIRIDRGVFAWGRAPAVDNQDGGARCSETLGPSPSGEAARTHTRFGMGSHNARRHAAGATNAHDRRPSERLRSYRFPQRSAGNEAGASATCSFVLGEIDIEIPHGSLVAVVGPVGSGKSSLASALVGEMDCISGRISRGGTLSYAPQAPWIMNETVRENIVFGLPFNPQKYADVLESCALEADLACLPAGDQAEIGERGATLSGGQKQRISIARAAYSDSDILILDDCLSAVDVKTSRAIFRHCVKGLLAHKTRILVTNSLDYLPATDLVITLDGGRIVEYGAFSDLLAAGGVTASLYASFAAGEAAEHLPGAYDPYTTDSSLHTATPIREAADDGSCIGRYAGGGDGQQLAAHAYASLMADSDISDAASTKSSNASGPGGPECKPVSGQSAADQAVFAEKGRNANAASDGLGPPPAACKPASALMSQEERATGQIAWPAYLAYIRAGGGYALFVGLVLCLVVAQGCRVGGDFWLRMWVRHRRDVDGTPTYIGIYALLGCLQFLWFGLFVLLLVASTYKVSTRLHARAFERVLRSPISFFDTTPLGRILNRFTRDIDSVDLALCDLFRQFYQNIGRSIGAFVTIALIVPVVLAPLVPLTIASWGLVYVYLRTSVEIQRIAAISRSPLYTHYTETLQGLATIRTFGAHDRFIAKADRVLDDANKPHWYALVVQNWVWLRVDFLSHALTLAVCMVVIAQPSKWDAAAVGLILVQATQMGSYATYAGRGWSELQNNMNAVERLDHYATALPQEPASGQLEAAHGAAADCTSISVRAPTRAWPERGTVIIRSLSMRYRPGLPLALDDVDMEIYSGERVGIVGRSGAGKSSIAAALFRLVEPAGGKVFIDGIDTQALPLARLRRAIGILPQDPVLFAGPLRANIDPGGEFSDVEIWHTLHHVCLHELVAQHPDGLAMAVNEGGDNFSAGQRQLLCLARVLVRRPRILVLDEATANVDHGTDAEIQRIISSSDWGMTVISIAHRLQTIICYDRIYVIDNGRVVESGTPLSLLERHVQPASADAAASPEPDSAFYRMVCEMDSHTAAHMLAQAKLSANAEEL
ncbi:hypothetical protein LPJ61_002870, partial [Coemansia biformis]